MSYSQYKVIEVSEGGCSTLLFGYARLPLGKIEDKLNQHASEGWNIVFQVVEQKRFLLIWKRESMVITFGK
tara:strand:+ start:199 stop:411 length:213 start_codon:yes stop_codon:yes gene_type:complete